MKSYRVNRRAAERLRAGHVWVHAGEVSPGLAPDACEVALLRDEQGRSLGMALVDSESNVPVRLASTRHGAIDREWILKRLEEAWKWRERVVSPAGNTGYRLVHGEADGLPGLMVDRFGAAVAIQLNMRNYAVWIDSIIAGLQSRFAVGPVVVEQSGERTVVGEAGDPARVSYELNGLQFEADLVEGPKTGAFLDQRENYAALSGWLQRLCGEGRGLDLFSSSGGFALHAARHLQQVDAVDSSAGAVERIHRNAQKNGFEHIRAIEADVRGFLRGVSQAKRRYECVVVDPPAYAKHGKHRQDALRNYFDLNLKALSVVAGKGLYVSCSCSQAVSGDDLADVVRQAAQASNRRLTLLERRSQSLDHREVTLIPESSYLKCFFWLVEPRLDSLL